jgi:hypothetical protein
MTDMLKSELIAYMKRNCKGKQNAQTRDIILRYLHDKGHIIGDVKFRHIFKELTVDNMFGSYNKGYYIIETNEDLSFALTTLNEMAKSLFETSKALSEKYYEKHGKQGRLL